MECNNGKHYNQLNHEDKIKYFIDSIMFSSEMLILSKDFAVKIEN